MVGVRVKVWVAVGVKVRVLVAVRLGVAVLVCVSVMVGVTVALRVGYFRKSSVMIYDPSPLAGMVPKFVFAETARLSPPEPSFINASI
jgi:hypothetical protein